MSAAFHKPPHNIIGSNVWEQLSEAGPPHNIIGSNVWEQLSEAGLHEGLMGHIFLNVLADNPATIWVALAQLKIEHPALTANPIRLELVPFYNKQYEDWLQRIENHMKSVRGVGNE